MGNEESSQPNSQDTEQNQTNNNQNDDSNIAAPSLDTNEGNNITNDMFPKDLNDDQTIHQPLEIDDLDSLTIEKSSSAFDEILNYSNSRKENIQKSFRTKALISQSLQSTLTSLSDSINENKKIIKNGDNQIDAGDLKDKKELERIQLQYQRSKSSFERNQNQADAETPSIIYADLETAKETLKKKKEELEELKKKCNVLFNQYMELKNSQNA